MKVGIIGYAGCGKTTFFNALTGSDAEAQGGKTGRLNLRELKVPDERIDKLSAIFQPERTIYANIQLADIPGQAPGSGGGFDASFVAKMREVDLLAIVVRAFEDPYSPDAPRPVGEASDMLAELLLADLGVIERKIDRIKKDHSKATERELLEKLQAALEAEKWLRDIELSPQEIESLSSYSFLTLKPVLLVVNTPEAMADEASAAPVVAELATLGLPVFALSAKVEAEIAPLDPPEQLAFLSDLGIVGTARDRFIRSAYAMLDLISFFTVGEDEVRAWTIRKGSTAQEAAGKIHTDLAKHFIRAEKMTTADLLHFGSEAKGQEAGRFELKGKTYLPEDGDILHIRANA